MTAQVATHGTLDLGTVATRTFPWTMAPSTLAPLPGHAQARDSYTLTRDHQAFGPQINRVKTCPTCNAAFSSHTPLSPKHPPRTLEDLFHTKLDALPIQYNGPALQASWALQDDGRITIQKPPPPAHANDPRHNGELVKFVPWTPDFRGENPKLHTWVTAQGCLSFGDNGEGKPLFWALQTPVGTSILVDKSPGTQEPVILACGEDVWADTTPGAGLNGPLAVILGLPQSHDASQTFELPTPTTFAANINWMADQAAHVLAFMDANNNAVPPHCDFGNMTFEEIRTAAHAWADLKEIVYPAPGNVDAETFFRILADGKFVLGDHQSLVHDIMAHWYFFMLAPRSRAMLTQCLQYELALQQRMREKFNLQEDANFHHLSEGRIKCIAQHADLITGRFGLQIHDKLCTDNVLRKANKHHAAEVIDRLIAFLRSWELDVAPNIPTADAFKQTLYEEYDNALATSHMLSQFAEGLPHVRSTFQEST